MRTALISTILLCAFLSTYSQEVVSTSGDYNATSNGSISWTLGEMAIETLANSEKVMTQGFQQGDLTVVSIKEAKRMKFEIAAFPNPATNLVKVEVKGDKIKRLSYSLIDAQGKVLKENIFDGNETQIQFEELSPSVYFLKIFDNKKEVKTFKIVKIKTN